MTLDELLPMLDEKSIKMGEIKKIAKKIKTDHELAQKLWLTKKFHPRLLAVLIMDKKCLDQNYIDQLVQGMKSHDTKQSNQISEWLLANQLTKNKKTIQLLESWQQNSEPILQRLFWYYQARLRWTGKIHDNTPQLLEYLEDKMESADPIVQWTMNFCAGWIGVFEEQYRSRCIALGKKMGLYKDEVVPKGCTPSYLPEFIKIEVAKRNKQYSTCQLLFTAIVIVLSNDKYSFTISMVSQYLKTRPIDRLFKMPKVKSIKVVRLRKYKNETTTIYLPIFHLYLHVFHVIN